MTLLTDLKKLESQLIDLDVEFLINNVPSNVYLKKRIALKKEYSQMLKATRESN